MTHSPIGGIGKTVGGIEISVGGIENSIGGIGKTVGGIGKTSQPAVIRSLDDERSTRRLKGLKVSPAGLHVERMTTARSPACLGNFSRGVAPPAKG